jgi:hypothetical protein
LKRHILNHSIGEHTCGRCRAHFKRKDLLGKNSFSLLIFCAIGWGYIYTQRRRAMHTPILHPPKTGFGCEHNPVSSILFLLCFQRAQDFPRCFNHPIS